eukprot:11200249-Lingulodinium_polyedra.AAC.1
MPACAKRLGDARPRNTAPRCPPAQTGCDMTPAQNGLSNVSYYARLHKTARRPRLRKTRSLQFARLRAHRDASRTAALAYYYAW